MEGLGVILPTWRLLPAATEGERLYGEACQRMIAASVVSVLSPQDVVTFALYGFFAARDQLPVEALLASDVYDSIDPRPG
jgi:hypothetical protein